MHARSLERVWLGYACCCNQLVPVISTAVLPLPPCLTVLPLPGGVGTNLSISGHYRAETAGNVEIRIGDSLCPINNYDQDDSIGSSNSYTTLDCDIPDVEAGLYNVTVQAQRNSYFGAGSATFDKWLYQAQGGKRTDSCLLACLPALPSLAPCSRYLVQTSPTTTSSTRS